MKTSFRSIFLMTALISAIGTATPAHSQGTDTSIPPRPILQAVPGDGRVTLYWDDSAESFLDPQFNPARRNFEGYKVYRATDPEFKDALRVTDNAGNPLEYLPIAQFDRINKISGYHPAARNGLRFWLGEDTGLQRVFEDDGLVNGRTYYYAVVAYTHGDATQDFFIPTTVNPVTGEPNPTPFPNAVFVKRPKESTITPGGSNVVAITPQSFSPGYTPAQNPTVQRISGSAGGSISVRIIDEQKLVANSVYEITFRDTIFPGATTLDPDQVVTRDFSLRNTTTGDFLFRNEGRFRTEQLLIQEGLLVNLVNTGDTVKVNDALSRWLPASGNKIVHPYQFSVATRNAKLADYRIEFEDGVVLTSDTVTVRVGALTRFLPSEAVNFRVINTTSNQPVRFGFSVNSFIPRDLQDIVFVSPTTGFTVGGSGALRRTTNGGDSFQLIESGTDMRLNAVFFLNATTGWGVGEGGAVIRTTNGGDTWTVLTNGITRDLLDVWFLDANTGFAISTTARVGNQNQSFIYRTTDGGATWAVAPIANSTTTPPGASVRNLNGMYFSSASSGYIVGANNELIRTTDGGATWSRGTAGNPASNRNQAVHFADAANGWIVGSLGRIIRTSNGGTTWTLQTSGVTAELFDLHFVDASNGWAVGTGGTIIRTTNGGTTWTTQSSGTLVDLNAVRFTNATTGFAVGSGPTIVKTTDAGETWQVVNTEKRFRALFDNLGQARSDEIYFIEEFNNLPNQLTWKVSMLPTQRRDSEDPSQNDKLELITVKPFTSADVYRFSIGAANLPKVETTLPASVLDAIRVVPNPYVVANEFESPSGAFAGRRQLHFTHLPQQCVIRIFNVAGQLVQTLNVSNTFTESRYIWDMRNKDGNEIPYGVYIYHVESPGVGEKVGKFAVIK